jgi:hypothetical protein
VNQDANSLNQLDIHVSVVHLEDLIESMHDVSFDKEIHKLARPCLLTIDRIFCDVPNDFNHKELIALVYRAVENQLAILAKGFSRVGMAYKILKESQQRAVQELV